METYSVSVYTPTRVIVADKEVSSLKIPTEKGEINVLPEHTHIISQLGIGILTLVDGQGKEGHFALMGGVCKVLNKQILILAQDAAKPGEHSREDATRRLNEAQTKIDRGDGANPGKFKKHLTEIDKAKTLNRLEEISKR